jgi:thiamine-phosphate pyrophosphorylase
VNDRADTARVAGADGVHLTSNSISPRVIRQTFGDDFIIGLSTHSLEEAGASPGADFAVFGPVFRSLSKPDYGRSLGVSQLKLVASELSPLPILALGGITLDNAVECFQAGVAGIAGISLLQNVAELRATVRILREQFQGIQE